MKTKTTLITACWMLVVITSYAQTKTIPWLLRGNSNTDPSVNFIGTRDRQPLVFKIANQKAGYLDFGPLKANTGFGYQSLFFNKGSFNTANGYQALFSNVNGHYNTATGYQALDSNTNGSYNTATGYQALYLNRSGDYNTAMGYQALFSNTKGLKLHGIGAKNTAIGFSALYSNTTGWANTAVGSGALYQNTTGFWNIAIGPSALASNTEGSHNTANGVGALGSNTTGSGNLAEGLSSLASNTIGSGNTATGKQTLYFNETGNFNTAVGWGALLQNTTGSYNTAHGVLSLSLISSGDYNTALGYNANLTESGLSNSTAIGSGASVDASNKVRIGNESVTSIGGQVGWTSYSDERVKNDIKENVPGLAFIKALRPVTYHFSVDKENELLGVKDKVGANIKDIANLTAKGISQLGIKGSAISNIKDIAMPPVKDIANKQDKYDIEKPQFTGFLAQDVDAAAKKLNYDFSGVDKTGKIWGLRYSDFVVPLVKAVQELSQQNDDLRKENEALKTRLDKIDALVLKSQGSNVELGMAARLEQNTPNPFSRTTTINYYLPSNNGHAYINFHASNGSLLKTAKLSGTGKGTLTVKANELPSGVYQYALVVDGKVVDRKQMVQAR